MPDKSPEELFLESDIQIQATPEQLNRQTEQYQQGRMVSGPNTILTGDQPIQKMSQDYFGNIPFDVEEGLSPVQRFLLGFRSDANQKAEYLRSKFGTGNVLPTPDESNFLIKTTDEKGNPKVIMANESGFSAGDVASFGNILPQAAAAFMAVKGARSIPKVGTAGGAGGALRDMTAGAVAAETVGGLEDIGTHLYDTGTAPVGQIAKERALNVPVDVAIDAATGGAAKLAKGTANLLINPMGISQTVTQRNAIDAIRRIKDETGIELKLSGGEASGLPVQQMLESYVEAKPSGTGAQRALKAEQDKLVSQFQAYLFGGTKTEEEIGQAAVNKLQGIRAGMEEGTSDAALALRKNITQGIEGELSNLNPGSANLLKPELGGAVRGKIEVLRDAEKEKSNMLFGAVKAMIGDNDKIFPASGLSKDADAIIKSLPSLDQIATTISPLVDAQGRTLTQEEAKLVPLKSFIPENIMARLNALRDAKDASFSLSDLQQLRSDVYDDIRKSEAVPGYGTAYLSKIGKALTKSIDEGIEGLKDPNLKTLLKSANEHYKKDVLKFEEAGIGDLFTKVREPGYVENSGIIDRLIRDPDKYSRTIKILGENSQEANTIRKFVTNDIFNSSKVDIDGELIDSKQFIKTLKNFADNNRSTFNDVFKGKASTLMAMAKAGYIADGEIPAKEIREILTSNKGNRDLGLAINKLVNARQLEKQAYRNTIIKKFTKAELGADAIKPSEFVNNFLSDANPTEIKQVMSLLSDNPDLTDQIRRKSMEKLFLAAERNPTAMDMTLKAAGDKTVMASGESIFKQLSSSSDKFRSVLGSDTYDLLHDYLSYEAARTRKREVAQGTGMLAKGAAISELLRGVPGFKTLEGVVKYKVLSNILASPWIRKWASNTRRIGDIPGMWSAIVTSEPFVKGIVEDFGRGTEAYRILRTLKGTLQPSNQAQPQPSGPTPEEAFLDAQDQPTNGQ